MLSIILRGFNFLNSGVSFASAVKSEVIYICSLIKN